MAHWQAVAPGQALTHWAMAAPQVRHYPGQATALPDQVDYTFVNNWTATPDLPCRAALRTELPGRVVPCPDGPFDELAVALDGPFDELAVALDGPELDFSCFRHRPTLIARTFRCRIRGAGPVRLRVSTCGGIRLWLDGNPAAVFEPFTRNQPQATEVTLNLSGAHDLTLRMEDLHERDTVCFFAVTLLHGSAELALPPGFDADAVSQAAVTLASLRTERLFHEAGPITLVADVPPAAPMVLHIPDLAPWERGGLVSDPAQANPVTVRLTPDQPRAVLADVVQAGPGCISIPIETRAGGARITRHLGTTTLPRGTALTGNLLDRKAQAAALIAAGGGFEPSVAALLACRGEQPGRVAAILDPVLTTIEQRWDCCDFSILPLLRLWRDARGTLPGPLADRMRVAFLNWRYWLDEPGDDVMWFWSENHVLCFHAAQLVAGRLFPDEVFPNSGKTGRQHAAQAHARLIRWFDAIDADGLVEWNSAAYYPIDLIGLFTLHDMDPDLAPRAARVIDRICVMTALHMTGGVPAGTQGRCYEKELLAGPLTELGPVMAIALGARGGPDFVPGYDRASALFCLSDYAPPPGLPDLAAPAPGATVAARYTQGAGHTGRLTLWKSADAQLSSVTDLKTGERGYQVQVVDVQLARHPAARLWLNHPGEPKPWGERRPSLLAGSHVMPRAAQDGPVALVIWDIDRDWTDIPFTQAFADPAAFGPPERAGDWLVFAGTVGLWCSAPLDPVQAGLYRGALWRAVASRVGWAVALRLPAETPAQFAARLAGADMAFDAGGLALSAAGLGPHRLDLSFDGPLHVDGTALPFAPLSPLPHIARDGGPLAPWEDRHAPAG